MMQELSHHFPHTYTQIHQHMMAMVLKFGNGNMFGSSRGMDDAIYVCTRAFGRVCLGPEKRMQAKGTQAANLFSRSV